MKNYQKIMLKQVHFNAPSQFGNLYSDANYLCIIYVEMCNKFHRFYTIISEIKSKTKRDMKPYS